MKFNADINIILRKGILDVQGKTVEHALHALEYSSISNVHIGKFVRLEVEAQTKDEALSIVQSACDKLIANPIMEDYHITITEA